MPSTINRWAVAGLAVITACTMILLASAPQADAGHEPANKVAAAGSDIDTIGQDDVVLSETVRVSSTQDLVLQLTSECSILTELTTGPDEEAGASDNAMAFGAVRMRIEIDGTPVLVATDDDASSEDDAADDDNEPGEVTFCNRTYERTVTDGEDPQDGIDEEHDYIRTRTANAFNWLATDIGFNYDDPANGNNIVEIVVYADYDVATAGDAVADAFIGSRTLIAEPTNASVHEAVEPTS
jgi:hypothetical protein